MGKFRKVLLYYIVAVDVAGAVQVLCDWSRGGVTGFLKIQPSFILPGFNIGLQYQYRIFKIAIQVSCDQW